MNRNLLVDYIPFNVAPEVINEMIEKNNGRLIVSGVLQRANVRNQNGRVYPKPILEREVQKYMNTKIKDRGAIGELDHPQSEVINIKNVSHNILEMHWEGDDLVGKIEILGTPSGNILKELFRSGIKLGISSRAMGNVKKIDENTVEVDENLELICFDFVSTPSTQGAYMSPLNEGVQPRNSKTEKYAKINKIITDILIKE